MNKLGLILLFIMFCGITFAQNPFEKYGYKPKIATLSKGKYIEHFDNDSIVRIGSILFNTYTNTITAFVIEKTKFTEAEVEPTVMSRWMNPDPLSDEFPEWSPYNFVENNPISKVDPDGLYARPFGDYFSRSGTYLGSDGIDDNKVYLSTGNKTNFQSATKTEVPGGISSLSAIRTSLRLTNAPSKHRLVSDTEGGQHEVRFDIDLDGGTTSYSTGSKLTIGADGIGVGNVNGLDVDGVDTSKTDILGHSHPTATVIGDNKLAYTFTATEPSDNDKSAFKNYSTNIISGNLERKTVTKNKNGTYNTPVNRQGGVFYNSKAKPILTIGIKTINNILSNYENGKIKK
ncbi:hypothetical protein [Aquimarina algiphila]|uniref:hypothetical protein n=1 Tax=Aquimarina algiphila TaxID=2047982 RepID=UPI00232F6A2C|nr:hypothetical protein [Aquimarina algiphila]